MKIYLFLLLSISSFRNQKVSGNEITGIENAPKAFIGLFHGDNVGKMLVRL